MLADIGVNEVGLLSVNGKLEDVLAPGSRRLYWKGASEIEVERMPLAGDLEVPANVVRCLRQLSLLARFAETAEVPAESAGLVFIDGGLVNLRADA